MAEAFLDKKNSGKSNLGIDQIVKEYYVYAGEEITAGSFVEFVNGVSGIENTTTGEDTHLSTKVYSGYVISATPLTNKRIFIAHCGDYSRRYLYGIVCEINGTTITYGEDIQLSTTQYTGASVEAITLPNGNVFLVHSYDSDYHLYGTICEVNGLNITVKTSKAITTSLYTGRAISATLLSNGDVFISHTYSSSNCLYGVVCKIDGVDITVGTDTMIDDTASAGYRTRTIPLSNNRVFIVHSRSSSYYLYGNVCEISGFTILKGTPTQLFTSTYSGYHLDATLLSNDKVLILHGNNSNNYYLYGLVCTFQGTTIVKGSSTLISNATYSTKAISSVVLHSGKVFVAHTRNQSNNQLEGRVVTVEGNSIKSGEAVLINTESNSALVLETTLLPSGEVFVAHNWNSSSSNYFLYGRVVGIDEITNKPLEMGMVGTKHIRETQVKLTTKTPFNGLAISGGEGGTEIAHKDKVEIIVPKMGEDE